MKFKQYLKDNSYLDAITYELYCDILECSDEDLDYLIEYSPLDESEASDEAKKRGLEYIGFGRYTTKDNKDTVIAVSKAGKLVDIEPRKAVRPETEDDEETGSGEDSDKIRLKNVAVKLRKHVDSIASDLKTSKDHIVKAYQQPKVYNVLKHFGFSVGNMAKAASKSIKTLNVGLKGTIEELEKTKALKKLKSGAMKVDEFLGKHPALKKIGGAAIGGFMIYQWLNMTFSGDVEDDYDLSNLPAALKGEYGMKDLLGTTSGLKGMAQLGIGLATGGLPIWIGGVKGLSLALTYSGAKLSKNHDLVKKAKDKMNNLFKKEKQES